MNYMYCEGLIDKTLKFMKSVDCKFLDLDGLHETEKQYYPWDLVLQLQPGVHYFTFPGRTCSFLMSRAYGNSDYKE